MTLFFLAVGPNLHAAKCSNASLKGTYGYSSQGFDEVTPDIFPFAQTGLIVYDGQRNISSGTFTFSTRTANGGSSRGTFTGTYSVSPDCSGTVVVETDGGDTFHFDLVVLGPGKTHVH